MRAVTVVVAESGADVQSHELLRLIGAILRPGHEPLHRMRRTASRKRTNGSSGDFVLRMVSGGEGWRGDRAAGGVRALRRFECNVLHSPQAKLKWASKQLHREDTGVFEPSPVMMVFHAVTTGRLLTNCRISCAVTCFIGRPAPIVTDLLRYEIESRRLAPHRPRNGEQRLATDTLLHARSVFVPAGGQSQLLDRFNDFIDLRLVSIKGQFLLQLFQ